MLFECSGGFVFSQLGTYFQKAFRVGHGFPGFFSCRFGLLLLFAGLQMDSEKLASTRSANDSRASGEQTGSDSESVLISDIRGKKTQNFNLKTENSAPPASDWVYALKDVSFEVKRGELKTLKRSKKEISKKCLAATKVPDSGS